MKTILKNISKVAILLFLLFQVTSAAYAQDYSNNNPSWAPSYSSNAQYYYLPDIEAFFDLNSGNFVVLNNGQWISANSLNNYYPNFDLATSFVVVLNNTVYQPWLHSQYYISHYPRYYYKDYYDHSNIPYVRGYNENQKSAIYWPENQRSKARSWDNTKANSKNFKYSDADKKMQEQYNNKDKTSNNNSKNQSSNSQSQNQNTNTNHNNSSNNNNSQAGNTNYKGNQVGRPVKVNKDMKNSNSNSGNSKESNKSNNSNEQKKSNSGNNQQNNSNTRK